MTTMRVWSQSGDRLHWDDAPEDLREAFNSGMLFAAFNAGFDRAIWNAAWPESRLDPVDVIDVMVQAVASGLPPALEGASSKLGLGGKQKDGRALIKLFCVQGALPAEHLDAWVRFLTYAATDVDQMREVYRRTRRLPPKEWTEYWAAEQINERGVGVDRRFAERADALALDGLAEANKTICRITEGQVSTVTQVQRLGPWLWDKLPDTFSRSFIDAKATAAQLEEDPEEDEDENVTVGDLTMKRERLEKLVAYLKGEWNDVDHLIEVIEARIWGGGASFKKFRRILDQTTLEDPRMRGQIIFNGAAQTGRFSSKGVQVHNLTRSSLGKHEDLVISRILATPSPSPAEITALGGDQVPCLRKLALLVRPTLVAEEGATFVWSDWSNIEARVAPWLAGSRSTSAVEKLERFAAIDQNPSLPDMYRQTAGAMWHVDPATIDKKDPMRQRGKIAELSLGFAGGKGALQSMAAGSGLYFPDDEAKEIVDLWRAANPWAPAIWKNLWDAMQDAFHSPGTTTGAGRLKMQFEPRYRGGTLFMELPSGRLLTYAGLAHKSEKVHARDTNGALLYTAEGQPVLEDKDVWRYSRGYGRARLWRGVLIENATQAVAADILRGTLVRIEQELPKTAILHVHDEVVLEVTEDGAELVRPRLQEIMRRGFDWSEGLPLWSDETVSTYYTKAEG
jgi:DNA polymerase